MRPNKLKRQRLEQRKGYSKGQARRTGGLCSQTLNLPSGLWGKVFIGGIGGEGCRVCDLLLIGWWWGSKAVLQESCAQPEVAILHLGGGLSSAEELKDTVLYVPWGGTRTLPQGHTIVSWLLLPCFCIPTLPWLAAVWTCPLELREGHRGWLKPISYKQEMGDTERLCTRSPTGSCSVSLTHLVLKLPLLWRLLLVNLSPVWCLWLHWSRFGMFIFRLKNLCS